MLKHVRFSPPLWAIILTLLGMMITARLGYWQLQRAEQKRAMIVQFSKKTTVASLPANSLQIKQYQQISAKGDFLNDKTLLLDNQFYNHQLGFHVITPLKMSDGKLLLVDRGWVKAGKKVRKLPGVIPVKAVNHLVGRAYYPGKTWVLADINYDSWPRLIPSLEIKRLQKLYKEKLTPFILRLAKGQPNGFIRDWKIVSMPPERHLAYALQWFSFCGVMLIIFIGLNLRRKHAIK